MLLSLLEQESAQESGPSPDGPEMMPQGGVMDQQCSCDGAGPAFQCKTLGMKKAVHWKGRQLHSCSGLV